MSVSRTVDALDTNRSCTIIVFFAFNKVEIRLIRGDSVD